MKTCAAFLLGLFLLISGARAQGTYFTDGNGTFSTLGEWSVQGFTIYSQTTFVMRFTADYKADYSIVTAGQLSNFKNNRIFTGYGNFDDSFGYHSVTLAPGTYYAAIRNQVSGTNAYRWELDYKLRVPNFYLAANGISTASYVAKGGGTLWHPFSVVAGYRYYIDGCNSGVETECIPASQLSLWQNQSAHSYYPDYSGSGGDQPGFYRLWLAPGNYHFAFRNSNASNRKAVTYIMQLYHSY